VLYVLDILVLTAHFLCVNLASGGPLVGAWLDWRGVRGDGAAARAAVTLARSSLVALVAGAALGLVLGLLRWDTNYRQLWVGPLSYKMHWAAVEAVFSLVLLLGWWLYLPGYAGGKRWATLTRGLVAVLASTNLLYHFPFLFSVAAHLHSRGYDASERINGAAFRRLMVLEETPALAVHVVLASLAVAGVATILVALREESAGGPEARDRLARYGAWWALAPSLLQLPVGLWTLTALPADAQSRIMGDSGLAILVFLAAIGSSLWLMGDLAHVAFGETHRSRLRRVVAAMLTTVALMTAMQQQARGFPQAVQKSSPSAQPSP
jgi:hypothetical protein